MTEGRIADVRRLGITLGVSLVALSLAGCQARKETGPDDAARQDVPEVAASVPPAVVDPAAARPLESFDGMDADSDGFVTSAEHAKAAQTMFQMLDADKDGTVTVAEIDAANSVVSGTAAPQAERESAEKTVAALDSDSDGKLTLAEYVAGSNGMFAKMDTNKDDRVDRAECDAAQVVGRPTSAPGAKTSPTPGAK